MASSIPIFQIDAFADAPFSGNPAAVCPLETWLPDETLQAIAGENNLAETAFWVREGDRFELRWFTPKIEVDLCGHATLASGYVILSEIEPSWNSVRFTTRQAGELEVARAGDRLRLELPARPPTRAEMPAGIAEALGVAPREVWTSVKMMAVLEDQSEVAAVDPDLRWIEALDQLGLIVTAPGDEVDFVSRFFAPGAGIAEDPVTGSAHCTLAPYWAQVLGKTSLEARQLSARGGNLGVELNGDRVALTGNAHLYLRGRIEIG